VHFQNDIEKVFLSATNAACDKNNSKWLYSSIDKKLSYYRETAHQLCSSFSASSLIMHFTETASVVQLHSRRAKLVLSLSANKPCDIRGWWSFQTLHTLKVVCCITKPLRDFIIQTATHLKISERWWCIMWIIAKFSGSTQVHRLLCSKPPQSALKSQFFGHIFVTDS